MNRSNQSGPCANIFFIEPSPDERGGFRVLGYFAMAFIPRIHETVTLSGNNHKDPQRYRVRNVIHHIHPLRLAAQTDFDQMRESHCTCVVAQEILDIDIVGAAARYKNPH